MEIDIKDIIYLIDKYVELTKLERCDIRVIETLVQVIMSYVPINIENKLKSTSRN